MSANRWLHSTVQALFVEAFRAVVGKMDLKALQKALEERMAKAD